MPPRGPFAEPNPHFIELLVNDDWFENHARGLSYLNFYIIRSPFAKIACCPRTSFLETRRRSMLASRAQRAESSKVDRSFEFSTTIFLSNRFCFFRVRGRFPLTRFSRLQHEPTALFPDSPRLMFFSISSAQHRRSHTPSIRFPSRRALLFHRLTVSQAL